VSEEMLRKQRTTIIGEEEQDQIIENILIKSKEKKVLVL